MGERIPFVRWLIIACATVAGLFIMWQTKLLTEIWHKDASCLSLAIFALFLAISAYLGMSTWRSKEETLGKSPEELGWFASELCMGMGMLGTAIGLIMMLSGFDTLDVSNVESIQQLLTQLGGSIGTALYTTVVGLACGINIKIQTFNLSVAESEVEN